MKKVTSHDVAKLAGVSQSTVSFVLNNVNSTGIREETKQRVLNAARQLNYRHGSFANSVKTRESELIGVMVPNITNPYYPMVINCIEEHAAQRGYGVLFCSTERRYDKEDYYIKVLKEKDVRGIIYAFTPFNYKLFEETSASLPVVVIGEKDSNINADIVGLNSYKAGEIVLQHLYKLGHRHIAYISGPLWNFSAENKKRLGRVGRLEGISETMKQFGIQDKLVVMTDKEETEKMESIYEVEIGFKLTQLLLNENKNITAIIGANDMTCLGIMDAIKYMELKIPEDVAVCGFDNTFIAQSVFPRLTSVDHGISLRSRIAVEMLLDKFNRPNNTETVYNIEYEPQLVVRESTLKK